MHIKGFVVNIVKEIVDDERLQGAMTFVDGVHLPRMYDHPSYLVSMKRYRRVIDQAHRTNCAAARKDALVPDEFMMAILGDCRVRKGMSAFYKEAFELLTAKNGLPPATTDHNNQVRRFTYLISD